MFFSSERPFVDGIQNIGRPIGFNYHRQNVDRIIPGGNHVEDRFLIAGDVRMTHSLETSGFRNSLGQLRMTTNE